MKDFEDKILQSIIDNMFDKSIKIKDNDEFINDLGFDSIRLMGLFYSLEDEFEIDIINGDKNYLFFSIVTVGDLKEIMKKII